MYVCICTSAHACALDTNELKYTRQCAFIYSFFMLIHTHIHTYIHTYIGDRLPVGSKLSHHMTVATDPDLHLDLPPDIYLVTFDKRHESSILNHPSLQVCMYTCMHMMIIIISTIIIIIIIIIIIYCHLSSQLSSSSFHYLGIYAGTNRNRHWTRRGRIPLSWHKGGQITTTLYHSKRCYYRARFIDASSLLYSTTSWYVCGQRCDD